jgi:plastocyanin domain-containing protein
MSIDQIAVTVVGLLAIAGVAWFFWGPRGEGVKAAVSATGLQETMILVKGGYTPDVIVVDAGKPVRLNFRREETAACSEQVLFPDFGRSADLPEGETVAIDLTPEQPGEYGFECGMGMLHGKLVVR